MLSDSACQTCYINYCIISSDEVWLVLVCTYGCVAPAISIRTAVLVPESHGIHALRKTIRDSPAVDPTKRCERRLEEQ